MNTLNSKKVVLGICSSIAIYKAAELISELKKLGAEVKVIMTENASKLMSERIFQTLSQNKVNISLWDKITDWQPEHISLADWADLFLVAPASANCLGLFANGIANDFLSTYFLANNAPVFIAPAMNSNMFANLAVQENIATLKRRNVKFIDPQEGKLACGVIGKGRLAEVSKIIEFLQANS